jgi:hypothetical protein
MRGLLQAGWPQYSKVMGTNSDRHAKAQADGVHFVGRWPPALYPYNRY